MIKRTEEEAAGRVMVALDYPDAAAAEALVRELRGDSLLFEGRDAAVLCSGTRICGES